MILEKDSLFKEGLMYSNILEATNRKPRSASRVESTPGLRTFITTSVPFNSLALSDFDMHVCVYVCI